jgi:hypothetical protein
MADYLSMVALLMKSRIAQTHGHGSAGGRKWLRRDANATSPHRFWHTAICDRYTYHLIPRHPGSILYTVEHLYHAYAIFYVMFITADVQQGVSI